jgi:DNA-binding protein YbaB
MTAPPVDPSGIQRLLSTTMEALNQARGSVHAGDGTNDEEAEPILGYGESAEGMIRMTAVPGGRLDELYLDPRVMRMTTVTLAEEILAAANAALADLQEKLVGGMAAPDLESLAEQLKDVQEQSTREMASFLQSLEDAQARIAAGGR